MKEGRRNQLVRQAQIHFDAGKSAVVIAKLLGVGKDTVYRWGREGRLKIVGPTMRHHDERTRIVREARNLIDKGVSIKMAAKGLNISYSTLYGWMKGRVKGVQQNDNKPKEPLPKSEPPAGAIYGPPAPVEYNPTAEEFADAFVAKLEEIHAEMVKLASVNAQLEAKNKELTRVNTDLANRLNTATHQAASVGNQLQRMKGMLTK